MKEVFAEDICVRREDGALLTIERPGQIETRGDRARSAAPHQVVALHPARRSLVLVPAAAAPTSPPPTDDELAEMEAASDKTQIVDSSHGSEADRGAPRPASRRRQRNGETRKPVMARKGVATPSPNVIIGEESEAYSGSTVVGPGPSARPVVDSGETRVGEPVTVGVHSTMLSPLADVERRRRPQPIHNADGALHSPEDATAPPPGAPVDEGAAPANTGGAEEDLRQGAPTGCRQSPPPRHRRSRRRRRQRKKEPSTQRGLPEAILGARVTAGALVLGILMARLLPVATAT
jgi:hypothetical protein